MQNKKFNATALVQMSIMVAISVVLILVSSSLPMFNFVINFILPIPMAYIYIKYDLNKVILANFVVLLLSCLFVDLFTAVSFAIMIFIISFVLGFCFKRKIDSLKTILFMAIAFIVITALQFIISVNIIAGISFSTFINQVIGVFQKTVKDIENIYINSGVSKSQVQSLVEPLKAFFDKKLILTFIQTLLILSGIINAYITELITVGIFRRLRIEIPKIIKFYEFHMHNLVLAFGIIAVCIGLLLERVGSSIGIYISTTVYMVGQVLLLICGISLVVYYLKSKAKMKNAAIVLIVILTLFISVVMYMYVFLGLIDTFVDFRKIERNRTNKKTGE